MALPPALHLAHEEDPHCDQQQHREPAHQNAQQRGCTISGGRRGNLHAVLLQHRHESGILGRIGLENPAIGKLTGHLAAGYRDLAHLAGLNFLNQLRVGDLCRRAPLSGVLEQVEQCDQQ
jgi:hypothetical protein